VPHITKEAFERAEKTLDEKLEGHGYHCSICGGVRCTLHPNIFSIPELPPGSNVRRTYDGTREMMMTTRASGESRVTKTAERIFIDLMLLTCDNCGHVDFFNAHQLKVFEDV